MPQQIPNLTALKYEPQNFRDLAETALGRALWAFLIDHDNIIRMATAIELERSAVEPLATGLILDFGDQIQDDRVKQMIGHMVRQIVEGMGYRIERSGVRITRPSLFTSGAIYRSPDRPERPMKITREQRDAWVRNTQNSPFNQWLDSQVKRSDGTLDLDRLYEVAKRYGVTATYPHLNPGQQRMNIGVQLRSRVPKSDYTAS